MRAWLQRPWFSALLVVAAGASVYWNIVRPLQLPAAPSPGADPVREDVVPSASVSPDASLQAQKRQGPAWEEMRAALAAARVADPFVWRALPTSERHKRRTARNATLPRLAMIAIHAEGRYAWIDGRLVREGQSVRGWKVVAITHRGVLIRRAEKARWLLIDSRNGGRR